MGAEAESSMNKHVLKCYGRKAIKILLKNLLANKTIIYCIAAIKLSMQAGGKMCRFKTTKNMWHKGALWYVNKVYLRIYRLMFHVLC